MDEKVKDAVIARSAGLRAARGFDTVSGNLVGTSDGRLKGGCAAVPFESQYTEHARGLDGNGSTASALGWEFGTAPQAYDSRSTARTDVQ